MMAAMVELFCDSFLAEDAAVSRVQGESDKIRRFARVPLRRQELEDQAAGGRQGRGLRLGTDVRFIVTNLRGAPRWLYEATASAAKPRI
jgi:hypothetical protein